MSETVSQIGEFGLIDRIDALLRRKGGPSSRVAIGIGDDCAAFQPKPGHDILVTCDAMVEGRHYLPRFISPPDLGRRAMTINVSDIGAMGGIPLYALISLGLQPTARVDDVEAFYLGCMEVLDPFHAFILGGNITRSEGLNFIDITLIGEIEQGLSVRRSTAKPGDIILVTGYPGQSAAGLNLLLSDRAGDDWAEHPLVQAYNRPCHRAVEGAALARSGLATAMIDISDGLLGDLGHICDQSRVDAVIFGRRLPVSPALLEGAGRLKRDPLSFVLGDSDDYELIITCRPEHMPEVQDLIRSSADVPATLIGEIIPSGDAERNIHMISPDGATRKVSRSGWDHFSR